MEKHLTVKLKTKKNILVGLLLIGAAVLLILGDLGLQFKYHLETWRIVLGLLCLAIFVERLLKLRLPETVFPLAFLFMIFEPLIAQLVGSESSNLISNWTVLLAALLLTIGLEVILPEKFCGGQRSVGFERSALYLEASELADATISDHAGSTNVYVSNTDAYPGDGTIRITDNVGSIKLHLPGTWNVILEHSDNLGRVSMSEQEGEVFDQSITVKVYDNVGSVKILFD